jgi:hypothetical protein
MPENIFLTPESIHTLTGRKRARLQIEALRKMAIPFWVNARGCPVVAVAAITGAKNAPSAPEKWQPTVVK